MSDSLPSSSSEIHPWETIRSEEEGFFRIFRVVREWKRCPVSGREFDFYILDCPDWVNVIALTPDRQIVLIEQYRHGSEEIELEIPGGVMDDNDTSPVETGVRELREETGFEGEEAQELVRFRPNPAMIRNWCHVILVKNCRRVHPTHFDETEWIATRLVPIEEIPNLIASNQITNAMVLAALYHFDVWRRAQSQRG